MKAKHISQHAKHISQHAKYIPQHAGDDGVYFEVNDKGQLYISHEHGEPLLFDPGEVADIADLIGGDV